MRATFTGYNDAGRLWHTGSQNTGLFCHVPLSTFLLLCMITIHRRYRQTDGRTDVMLVAAARATRVLKTNRTRSIRKMLGPFATASRRTPHCHSPGVTACASMSRTTTTTTTTTRDRGDRYGPMEWAQSVLLSE